MFGARPSKLRSDADAWVWFLPKVLTYQVLASPRCSVDVMHRCVEPRLRRN